MNKKNRIALCCILVRLTLFLLYLVNCAHFLLFMTFSLKFLSVMSYLCQSSFMPMSTNLNAVVGCWWKSANAEFSRKAKTCEATGNRKKLCKSRILTLKTLYFD